MIALARMRDGKEKKAYSRGTAGQAAPGAKVDWFPIDFAAATADDYAALAKAIGDRDVGVLVNNVGMSHNMPVPFHETEDKELENIVNINVFATLRVTKIVTPGMVKRCVFEPCQTLEKRHADELTDKTESVAWSSNWAPLPVSSPPRCSQPTLARRPS